MCVKESCTDGTFEICENKNHFFLLPLLSSSPLNTSFFLSFTTMGECVRGRRVRTPSLRFSQISHAHISARKTPAREGERKEEREREREERGGERERERELRVWKTVCVCMKEKSEREFVEESKSVSVCVCVKREYVRE